MKTNIFHLKVFIFSGKILNIFELVCFLNDQLDTMHEFVHTDLQTFAQSEDSDHSAHLCSLIGILRVRIFDSQECGSAG